MDRSRAVPQPGVDRLVPFSGHPVVAGVVPADDERLALVVRTAASLARAVGSSLYLAYADTGRYTVTEHPDGSVTHASLDPDAADDAWQATRDRLAERCGAILAAETVGSEGPVEWELRYLAGRPDRALTHLARAVDAAVIVVGTRPAGAGHRLREALEGSVAAHLAHHQHRPVLTVPLAVVDWKDISTPWER